MRLSSTTAVVLLAVLGAAVAHAKIGASERTLRFPVPCHGEIELRVPKTVAVTFEQPEGETPPAIALVDSVRGAFAAALVVSWPESPEPDFWTPSHLQRELRRESQEYLDQVPGSELEIEQVAPGPNLAYAYSLTDPEPKPDEFTYLRQGVAKVGDLLVTYHIFMHSRDPDPVPMLENIVLHAVHRPPASTSSEQ
jgi:hypothetical protein